MKKEAQDMEKVISANIPDFLRAKVRPRAQPGPSCQPSGQPGGQEKLIGKKELAWRAEKALPGEEISR